MGATQKHRRRAGRAAAVLALVSLTGGCAQGDGPAGAAATPATTTVAADLAASTRKACLVRPKADTAVLSEAATDAVDANNPDYEAEDAVRAVLVEAAEQFADAAGEAADPALRAALRDAGRTTADLAKLPDPVSADLAALDRAQAKLAQLCAAAGAGPASPGTATASPAAAAGTLGARGSACRLPVTFALAQGWAAKSVEVDNAGPLSDLLRKGPLSVVCEIDGKPAGHLGFIRVWTGRPGAADPRGALRTFLTGEKIRKPVYATFSAGRLAGVQVAYEAYSETTEEYRVQRAFAVSAPGGVVVVALGGFDSAEDTGMLPAYELARTSVRPGN